MKYLTLILFCLPVWLAGCVRDNTIAETPLHTVSVKVDITAKPADRITRATDETQIKDLNVYLFGKSHTFKLHIYTRSTLLQFECPAGEYDIYIAANLYRDLGEMSRAEVETYTLTAANGYDVLPMSAKTTVTISAPKAGKTLTLPAIQIQRCVAKVAYNIRVDRAAAAIELKSVQVVNMPRKSPLFNSAQPSASKSDYMRGACSEIPALNGGTFSGLCYVFENLQGCVPGITSQSGKSPQNAPDCATFLLIRAMHGAKALAYTVYLGENNTDNFDVRRNSFQTLNITIRGDSEVDTRISSYTLTVFDDIADGQVYDGYCINDPQRTLYILIEGENNALGLNAEMEVTEGDGNMLGLDRHAVGTYSEFQIGNTHGMNYYELDYSPKVYNAANSRLCYNVNIYDEYGMSQTFEFEHKYANSVRAYIDCTGNGKGEVTASGAIFSKKMSATTDNLFALCDADGCTLTATPATWYQFAGWYADANYTRLLSAASVYKYIPTSYDGAVYPRFTFGNHTPLDANGTANCYIAPKQKTRYSFDATVQGNGRATFNISPRRLSGTQAKVIWETGTKKGAVIESVLFDSGRIFLLTGSGRGNALIGLFDTAGTCIWSWHIWADDYVPEKEYERYFSGAVFMDRNLGAIENPINRTLSNGMYYQWGRKDPFIGPATKNGYTTAREPAVFLTGYEHTSIHPDQHDPSVIMSVNYATKHPTTYIFSMLYPDGSSKADINDWLYTRHPFLWGNRSTTTLISFVTEKSIYDPCPAGWRVPDIKDFKDIKLAGYLKPSYTNVHYTDRQMTNYPLSGFFNGLGFSNNGTIGYVYTSSPYIWDGTQLRLSTENSSSISFSDRINAMQYFRHAANPVRCVKE